MASSDRNKRGVPRRLPVLIRTLENLEADCERRDPDALNARSALIKGFPWDALDGLRRSRQDRALRAAADELALLLARASSPKRQNSSKRFLAVRVELNALLNGSASLEDLFGSVGVILVKAGILPSAREVRGASGRARGQRATFYRSLKEELLGKPTVIRDLADGEGPREAAYRLLSRLTGLGRTTIKKAGRQVAVGDRERVSAT